MSKVANSGIVKLIFFGNFFYAICAVALSIEGSLQQGQPLNSLFYYILAFASTQVYYTIAYLQTETSADPSNLRAVWYAQKRKLMMNLQYIFGTVIFFCLLWIFTHYYKSLLNFNFIDWFSLLNFPLVAALYYGVEISFFARFNLRTIGWLKPFVIGYTWAGLVTVYPVHFNALTSGEHYMPTFVSMFLFVKNFMYITLLCILFDIKDYAMDYNAQLKTIVVKLGLRTTIFYFIIPLSIIGLGAFYVYAISQHFILYKILINTIPFILIITVAYSMSSRRSIFYYLIIIDGLMLIKALCGTFATLLF